MMAGGGGAGIAVEDNMDTWKKRATLRRPAILMMRRDASYFAGMTPNTVRDIGHNKSVHLLPFYSSGIVPRRIAIFGRYLASALAAVHFCESVQIIPCHSSMNREILAKSLT
jgi:hypothetical protein